MMCRQLGCAALPTCLIALLFLREQRLSRALELASVEADGAVLGGAVLMTREAA